MEQELPHVSVLGQLVSYIFNYVRRFGKASQNYTLLRRMQDCDPPKDPHTPAALQKTPGAGLY